MDYGGDNDFKRAKTLRDATTFIRKRADEPPRDVDLSLRQAELRARLDKALRQATVPSVWLPASVAILLGLVLTALGEQGSNTDSVGVGVITTGIALGIFRWGQEISARTTTERGIRQAVSVSVDLGFSDLSGIEFADGYFRARRLSGAKFSSGIFHNSDFREAQLIDARFTNGDFFQSNFSDADLTGAGLYRAKLEHCDLSRVSLVKATLVESKLVQANLDSANLTSADLRGADLSRASLTSVKFHDTWYSENTTWPKNFDPQKEKGLELVDASKEDKDIDLSDAASVSKQTS